MYSCAPDRNRVDVVDLDPYGTAAPFVDAAVQCITDGGTPFYLLETIPLTSLPGKTRPFVRDVYGPLCLGHQQLSREMVSLSCNPSRGPVLSKTQNIATPIMVGFQSRPNTLTKP